MKEFETVIGLEVHLQLNTATKIFCSCANRFGEEPNSLTCPVCLGLPGTLPVLNKKALEFAIKVAVALNCQINSRIKFDRKNYYYPDLPKGYQISQYDLPIAHQGWLDIKTQNQTKRINIRRAHLEEDAGKLMHDVQGSLVDYNRTGTPLIEIVTEPDLRSSQEAYDYLTALKLNLQYLNVSSCDMEKGSLRCDANISIREKGETKLGTKTELKNMNSFRAVKLALEHEVTRHQQVLLSGQKIVQQTLLWNDEKQITVAMRSKEEAHDYRYFPEPDLVPFIVDEKAIDSVKTNMPELPAQKLERFLRDYKISEYDAAVLIQDQDLTFFFEQCASLYPETKKICSWLINSVQQELNERHVKINDLSLTPQNLVTLIKKVEDGVISNLVGKEVLVMALDTGKDIDSIITEKGLTQVSDEGELENIIQEILNENTKVVEQIRQGKDSALGFLVGQAMKKTQGKANPKKIGELIKRRFGNG